MVMDVSAFSSALKQIYPDWRVQYLTYKNNPFYALVPKQEDFYGEVLKFPLIYGNSQNRSNTFANALAGTTNALLKGFLLTRNTDYSLASLSNEALEASQSNEGAFLEASKLTIDSALESLARSRSIQLFRSGTGSRGVVKAATSPATTVELQTIDDVVNFEVGQKLNASIADGGGSLRTTKPLITAIDRITGILTVGTTVSGDWAAGDYIFADGDYDAAMKGLDAWIPYSDRATKLAATFFNVVRSADATRLGGLYHNGSGSNVEEALVDGLNLAYREGAEIDYVLMNPMDISTLIKLLGSKVQRVQVSAEISENGKQMAAVGFNGIEIYYAGGSAKVLGDRNCMKGKAFGITLNTWKLCSLGKAIRLFEADGLKMLRSSSSDALDIRCFSYAQLGCNAPGMNIQISFV
jgi:hypothetical protein